LNELKYISIWIAGLLNKLSKQILLLAIETSSKRGTFWSNADIVYQVIQRWHSNKDFIAHYVSCNCCIDYWTRVWL